MAQSRGRILYLSTRKVDEDFGKIKPSLGRRIFGPVLQVLGLVTVTLPYAQIKVAVPKEDRSDIQKLDAVWKALVKAGEVGTIDEPRAFFYGRCRMRYQAFREINPPILYLTGETDRSVLALGGALKHARLSVVATAPEDATIAMFETDVVRTLAQLQGVQADEHTPDDQWIADVMEIHFYSSGSRIECEFLAERERWSQSSPLSAEKNVLLGSPLFVTYCFS